jgi:hypothetical protein
MSRRRGQRSVDRENAQATDNAAAQRRGRYDRKDANRANEASEIRIGCGHRQFLC